MCSHNLLTFIKQMEQPSYRIIFHTFQTVKNSFIIFRSTPSLQRGLADRYCQAQPMPRLKWAEWIYFHLIQTPPRPVYFTAAIVLSTVELSRKLRHELVKNFRWGLLLLLLLLLLFSKAKVKSTHRLEFDNIGTVPMSLQ